MERNPCIYILASRRNGTLYVGVTSCLQRRVWQHRNDIVEGFTSRYGVHRLVYYETCDSMYQAIEREKQIKSGSRRKKLELIESLNPDWRDLYYEIV
ncbi:MAG: GIY-YIG nuclease family protein [Halofilum sp. (in: g-proteobacteria)]|nr:GIY-YIG nuclease family protein [Halofilum sp. (in: g-proteobacteria)]